MDEFKERFIALLHCPNMSWNKVYQLLKSDPSLKFQKHTVDQLTLLPQTSSKKSSANSTTTYFSNKSIHELIRQYSSNGIEVITIFDKEYPKLLKEIYQPPWALFIKGDKTLLQKELKLAVVGSRQATPYGKNAIRLIFPELIRKGIVIVSGLAQGIDFMAHEQAIQEGGQTIAVIAGGFNHVYPKENRMLAMEMMRNQLVVSEYPPETKPERWQFPARNRIISGLAFGTLIIEAKQKSGSLITANYAVNEGRDVFALPGSIFNPYSVGPNQLIQQGAKLVTSAGDILDEI